MVATHMRAGTSFGQSTGGFTLLELMIVVSILAIVASIGVPQYVSVLRTARIGKAKHELKLLCNAIDSYTANNDGKLPFSLHQVGFGGKRDPWGVPYCYLNYADGTGDGLDWAIEAGIVDPSAFAPILGGGGGGSTGAVGGGGDGGLASPSALTAALVGLSPQGPELTSVDAMPVADVDVASISELVGRPIGIVELAAIQDSVRMSGNFSLFAGVPAEQTRRRNRYLFPLNTDYDLFSLGPDHQTAASLIENVALDDVIRANNGGFFGVASDY